MLKELKRDVEGKMKKAFESAERELAEVRTGRAHPGLIEGLHADYYGTPTMLKQMASITVPDPHTIVIQPWDPTAIPEIEKAIVNNPKLGLSPSNDGKVLRLNIPQLSQERREELQKLARQMAEHGRVSLRTIRREANDRIKKTQSEGTVSEDDCARATDEIQKMTDRFISDIDHALDKKLKDLIAI